MLDPLRGRGRRQARRRGRARDDRPALRDHRPLPADRGRRWKATAGVIGLVLCALALYAALAMALEDALGRTVLPLGRRAPIDGEPGVREQL